ncbi:hypothetical protein [Marinivivus vitaminiproducens]|uniref:hypothetical protein n=1 Tax=Marinivivus vitaminiproducens TaxID=3035935 RepID=UPI002797D02A|nr:hypothetical protein P4R82_08075 [Geminicoccaceae bacterium SCSIO 64248]
MTDDQPAFSEKTRTEKADRAQRLAKAMRANLAKRKVQTRARAGERHEDDREETKEA